MRIPYSHLLLRHTHLLLFFVVALASAVAFLVSSATTKNKSQNPDAFFNRQLVATQPPDQPRRTPQTDHKITTPKTLFSQKPQQKPRSTTPEKNHSPG